MLQFFIIMYKLYSEKPAVLNIPHKYKTDSLLKANLARSNSSLPMNVLVSQSFVVLKQTHWDWFKEALDTTVGYKGLNELAC